jgi:hypothetical protein
MLVHALVVAAVFALLIFAVAPAFGQDAAAATNDVQVGLITDPGVVPEALQVAIVPLLLAAIFALKQTPMFAYDAETDSHRNGWTLPWLGLGAAIGLVILWYRAFPAAEAVPLMRQVFYGLGVGAGVVFGHKAITQPVAGLAAKALVSLIIGGLSLACVTGCGQMTARDQYGAILVEYRAALDATQLAAEADLLSPDELRHTIAIMDAANVTIAHIKIAVEQGDELTCADYLDILSRLVLQLARYGSRVPVPDPLSLPPAPAASPPAAPSEPTLALPRDVTIQAGGDPLSWAIAASMLMQLIAQCVRLLEHIKRRLTPEGVAQLEADLAAQDAATRKAIADSIARQEGTPPPAPPAT